MGMGRVVLVQIAEASGVLCRDEESFQKPLGTKSSEELTTSNEEYGLTKTKLVQAWRFRCLAEIFISFSAMGSEETGTSSLLLCRCPTDQGDHTCQTLWITVEQQFSRSKLIAMVTCRRKP